MTLISDGPVGCLGVAKLCKPGGHLGAGVPKLLHISFVTSCLAFPTYGAKCGVLISQSLWIIEAFISYLQFCKKKKAAVVFRRPSDVKVSLFSSRLKAWSNNAWI